MPEADGPYRDFEEIAHSGGRATILLRKDAEGRLGYAMRWSHNRAGPAAITGVYVLMPFGIPALNFALGGMGEAFDPPMPPNCAPVFLASDSTQCWGHQCSRCDGYFRSGANPSRFPLTCCYCGLRAAGHQFMTPAQKAYCFHYAEQLVVGLGQADDKPADSDWQVVIDMDAIVDLAAGAERPAFYYAEAAQQTRFRCHRCDEFNDIRGRFGYCSSCGWRNNLPELRKALDVIRESLNGANLSPEAAVRMTVSEFDGCCRDFTAQIARRIPMKRPRRDALERLVFHDPDSRGARLLKAQNDIDLLRGMDADQAFIRKMMARRQIFEHNGGVADARYIEEAGDPATREGTLVRESAQDAHAFIGVVNRMVENFDRDFHEIFTPTELPIQEFRAQQQHIAALRGP